MKLLAKRDGPLVYRQRFVTRHSPHPLDLGRLPVLPAPLGAADLHGEARPLHRAAVRVRFRESRAQHRRRLQRRRARRGHDGLRKSIDTTGALGVIEDENGDFRPQTFPGWMTIPSYRDLATGRVVHFFFAWALVGTLLVWLVGSLLNRHLTREILPRGRDWAALPRDIADHARCGSTTSAPMARFRRSPTSRSSSWFCR